MSVEVSVEELIAQYAVLFFDAYGVLIDSTGSLPRGVETIDHLNRVGHPYFVVTNDASRSPENCARRYQSFGISVPAEQVITSGSLLGGYFRQHHLQGARCIVLGPEDSHQYVREAGGVIAGLEDESARVLVIGDESGYPFLESVDAALSLAIRKLDAGDPLRLVVPNPDLIYPAGAGRWGIASGTIAHMIESALALRHPGDSRARFDRLGKPFLPIFEEAIRRAGTKNAVMIGDQLETDIRGAIAAGLDAALVIDGVSGAAARAEGVDPKYRVRLKS